MTLNLACPYMGCHAKLVAVGPTVGAYKGSPAKKMAIQRSLNVTRSLSVRTGTYDFHSAIHGTYTGRLTFIVSDRTSDIGRKTQCLYPCNLISLLMDYCQNSVTVFWLENYNSPARWHSDTCSCFDTVLMCDRQTDGQTD